MTDYLVLGGGLAGCALATRLKEFNPSCSVTLVEAGPDEHANPLITEPMGTFQLHMSPLEYNYSTVPQKAYDGRKVYNSGGKLLSGSSSVNYAMWTRGGADDYNLWGQMVGDKRWSYEGMLPYFRRTETHHDPNADPQQHGFDGPIHTTASARKYPLKELMRSAFLEGTDLAFNPDANSGNPIGIAPYTENWHNGKRQPSGFAYGLKGVDLILNAPVKRVILQGTLAKGAELVDGRTIMANREIIVCCGAIRTPQTLMLSGIGPAEELAKHGITQLVDSPDVGGNFHDHCCVAQFYKIKDPEKGYAAGAAEWKDPTYLLGIPADVVVTSTAPREALKASMIADGERDVTDAHPHLQPSRGHIEILPIYAPTEAPLTDLNVPFDGTCITAGILNLLPTSRGSVRLASADPTDAPLIDPNYYSTEADKVVIRSGMRMAMRVFESDPGQKFIAEEFTPVGYPPLTSQSSDEEIDARVKRVAATWFHPAGSAAMGKVVNNDLQVIGTEGLRVVDPSVLPCPIGAHYQVATYALAEQAADIITAAWAGKN
jgi:choline dehydrogenase-like flavoprotein